MGFIYVIGETGSTDTYKIGISQTSVEDRLCTLQIGNPRELYIALTAELEEYALLEQRIHILLNKYRIRGEWFFVDLFFIESVLAAFNGVIGSIIINKPISTKNSSQLDRVPTISGVTTNPLTMEEMKYVSTLIEGSTGVSQRELTRRVYKLRGGANVDYSGDGPLYQVVNEYIKSL